jgi:hypothetical protein
MRVAHKPAVWMAVRQRSIKTINGVPVKEFWKRVAAGDIPRPK